MNILIVNVHSALNIGDDAIMRTTIKELEEAFPSAAITVAANDPVSWEKYAQIEVVGSLCTWVADCRLGKWRSRLYLMPIYLILLIFLMLAFRLFRLEFSFRNREKQRLLRAYYEADLLLSCGGGNFYAHHRASPALFWALATLAFGIGLGKKVVMLPQSIGPIEGGIQRRLARMVFSRVRTIMVRESISLNFVQNVLKINQVKTIQLPDLAFGFSKSIRPLKKSPAFEHATFSLGITIINREAQNDQFERQDIYEDAIIAASTMLAEERGAHTYLFVQCYGPSPDQDDRQIASVICDRMRKHTEQVSVLGDFDDAREIMSDFGQMECIIATRMHTAVFALINTIPVVLVGYQPKSRGLMKSFGLSDYYIDIEDVSTERLIDLVEDVLANRGAIQRQISAQMDYMQPLLTSWVEQIEAL